MGAFFEETKLSVDHIHLAKELKIDKFDLLLLHLAIQAIKESGHRYGSFLDAASTAAKFAVYITFLETGRNFRKTGIAHHVEPKRVKAIVTEVEHALQTSKGLKVLGTTEPNYLIGIPHRWKEKYPWHPGTSRVFNRRYNEAEERQLSLLIPDSFPHVLLIGDGELTLLIEEMHQISQSHLPEDKQVSCSESLLDHIKYRLLRSETISELSIPFMDLPVFALASNSYSPKGTHSRLSTMMDDTVRFINLLQRWVNEETDAFRAIETLAVPASEQEKAIQELDQMLQAWADKYHRSDGQPMVLQMALGESREFIL